MALFGNKKNEEKEKITTDDILMSLATTRTSINPDYMKNDAKRVVESLLYAIYTGNEQILPIDKMTDDYYKKVKDGLIRDKNNGIEKKLYNLEIKKVRPTNVDNSMMYLVTSVEFEIHFIVSYTQIHSTFNKKLTDELKIRYVFMNGTNYPNKKGWILGKDCDKREISSVGFDAEAYEREQYQKQYARRYGQNPYPQQGYNPQMQGGYRQQMQPMNNGYNQMNNYMPPQGYNVNQMPYPQQGYNPQIQGGYGQQIQPMNNGYNQMNGYMPQQGYNPQIQGRYRQQIQPVNNGYNPQIGQQVIEDNSNQLQNVPYNPLSQIHQAMQEQGPVKPIISPEMYNVDRLQATFGNKIIQEENQAYAGTIFQSGLSSLEQNQEYEENIENIETNDNIDIDKNDDNISKEEQLLEEHKEDTTNKEDENISTNNLNTEQIVDTQLLDDTTSNETNVVDIENVQTNKTNNFDDTLEDTNTSNISNEIIEPLNNTNDEETIDVVSNESNLQEDNCDKKSRFQRKNKRKSLDELKKEAEDFDDLDTLETI